MPGIFVAWTNLHTAERSNCMYKSGAGINIHTAERSNCMYKSGAGINIHTAERSLCMYHANSANQLAAVVAAEDAGGGTVDGAFAVVADGIADARTNRAAPKGVVHFVRLSGIAAVAAADNILVNGA